MGWDAILNRVVREGLSEKVPIEEKSEGGNEATSHVLTKGKVIPS